MLVKDLFYSPMDKMSLYHHFFRTLYNNASKVILIKGLPEDADYHFIISQLLLVGKIVIFQSKGQTYLLNGNIGGKCDEYYFPTRCIIANPILGSFDLERDVKAVPVYLTPTDRILDSPIHTNVVAGGMYSLISMCANILSECITTINTTLMNTRVHAIYTADTDSAAKSAEPVLRAIYMGKPYSVVTSELLERLNVNPLSEHGLATTLTETLEVCQYVLAMFWNGLGIDMNYNMKRERLITAEVDKNVQSLIVPVQTILETLNEGFDKANSLFGEDIHAELNPEFIATLQGDENDGDSNNKDTSDNTENNTSSRTGGTDNEELHGSDELESESESDNGESVHSGEINDEEREGVRDDGKANISITINNISGDNNDVTIESESESLEESDDSSEDEESISSEPENETDNETSDKDEGDDDK